MTKITRKKEDEILTDSINDNIKAGTNTVKLKKKVCVSVTKQKNSTNRSDKKK